MTPSGERPRQVVVVGAGGHAKVAIDTLRLSGWKVIGCTDADPSIGRVSGVPVLGTDAVLGSIRAAGVAAAFVAIGGNALRARIGSTLTDELGFELVTALHPAAVVADDVEIGAGAAIFAGGIVNPAARIGRLAIINTGATIDHDCRIGEAAHVAPNSALAGEVSIGPRAFLGIGSVAIPGVSVGADAVVGAGSVIVCDLPAGCLAYGNPARVRQ